MKRAALPSIEVAASASAVPIEADGAPARRVKLLPIGDIAMRDGRGPFQIRDRAHAEQVVAATRKWLGTHDFNFDYDHQIAFGAKPGVGGTAQASGWAKADDIEVADDGIYANNVEWTPDADAHLRARRYRYLSPLFRVAGNGDVQRLSNAALVNIGAIDLPAIAAGHSGEDDDMTFALIAAAAGLAATATEAEIISAIDTLKTTAASAPQTSTIAIAAGLAEDAAVEDIAASVTALKAGAEPDPAQFVPVAQVQGITAQLAVLTAKDAEREVAAAISQGKLAPTMRAWGVDLYKTDHAKWDEYIKAAPQIVAAGTMLDDDADRLGKGKLTELEIAACVKHGWDQAEYLAEKIAEGR